MFSLIFSIFTFYGFLHFIFVIPNLLIKSKRVESLEIAKKWKRADNSPTLSMRVISLLPEKIIFLLLWLRFIPRPKSLID